MNILAYTSSFNDKEAVARCLEAVLAQRYPVRKTIVVDNCSTDGTPSESFPPGVTLLRHARNLGTSGAAATAFQYALEKGYDWVWVLDQDTVPEPDALEKLVELFNGFDAEEQRRVGVLSSVVILKPTGLVLHGAQLTPKGLHPYVVDEGTVSYECDATIWSGSLFNMAAVREVGFPRFGEHGCWEDLALDYGDLEYSFRIKQAGYKLLAHVQSRILHPVGKVKVGEFRSTAVYSSDHSAFRRYLSARNMVYFWLYLYPNPNPIWTPLFLLRRLSANGVKMMLLERDRWRKIVATVVGAWDGLRKNLDRSRFGPSTDAAPATTDLP
jgi:GT2 family glycosyltransferase